MSAASPSPLKRWQQAALAVVSSRAPAASGSAFSTPEKSASSRAAAGGAAASSPSPFFTSTSAFPTPPGTPAAPASTPVHGDGGGREGGVGWDSVLPLLRVHRAFWRGKQMSRRRLNAVMDLVERFLTSDSTPTALDAALRHRELRAAEVESGLMHLSGMLKASRARAACTEVILALLNSNWLKKHYLSDIAAAPAAALGRVRALFNQVILQLLMLLRDADSSSELKCYSARALSIVYDSQDLMYLTIIGLPDVLRAFVDSNGRALHLSSPQTAHRADLSSQLGTPNVGSISVQQMLSPVGSLWCGVSEAAAVGGVAKGAGRQEAHEMSLRLSMVLGQVRGTGRDAHGAFTVRGTVADAKTVLFDTLHSGSCLTTYRVQVQAS